MGNIECTTEDVKAAAVYFHKYLNLRNMLLRGQLEREDFEDFMTCEEKKLSKKAGELTEIMADAVSEDTAKMMSESKSKSYEEFIALLENIS